MMVCINDRSYGRSKKFNPRLVINVAVSVLSATEAS